jgi:predicted permease
LRLLSAFAAGYTPLASTIDIDASLLLPAFAISVLTGILSGTISAVGKRDINSSLKEGGDKVTSSSDYVHRRQTLMFIQFALSFVALTVSALVVLSLYRLNSQNLGYDPDRILTLSTQIDVRPDEDFDNLQRRSRILFARILEETKAIPGVEAVALLGGHPLLETSTISPDLTPFDVEGVPIDPDAPFNATFNSASAGFFEMMGIALQRGRLFGDEDDENSVPVAMVNANFVEQFIPDGNFLGKRIHIRGDPNWLTIIGVVANVSSAALDQPEPAAVYYNLRQRSAQPVNIYVKSSTDFGELGKIVSDVIHNIEPLQTLQNVKPLNAIKADWLAPSTLRATLISLFGLLALVLTLSGVIGVVSCNVHQRIHEIGIHMAIGATPFNIVSMFITQGFKVYLVGLTFGLILLLAGAPLIEPMLYEISVLNVGIYLLSAAVLTLAVLIAMYLPAKKASAMSPREALHAE